MIEPRGHPFRETVLTSVLFVLAHSLFSISCGSGAIGATTESTTEYYPNGSVRSRGTIERLDAINTRGGP